MTSLSALPALLHVHLRYVNFSGGESHKLSVNFSISMFCVNIPAKTTSLASNQPICRTLQLQSTAPRWAWLEVCGQHVLFSHIFQSLIEFFGFHANFHNLQSGVQSDCNRYHWSWLVAREMLRQGGLLSIEICDQTSSRRETVTSDT